MNINDIYTFVKGITSWDVGFGHLWLHSWNKKYRFHHRQGSSTCCALLPCFLSLPSNGYGAPNFDVGGWGNVQKAGKWCWSVFAEDHEIWCRFLISLIMYYLLSVITCSFLNFVQKARNKNLYGFLPIQSIVGYESLRFAKAFKAYLHDIEPYWKFWGVRIPLAFESVLGWGENSEARNAYMIYMNFSICGSYYHVYVEESWEVICELSGKMMRIGSWLFHPQVFWASFFGGLDYTPEK